MKWNPNLAPLFNEFWCGSHGQIFVLDGDDFRDPTDEEKARVSEHQKKLEEMGFFKCE